MDVKDFYYDLPPERIAQTPLADRSASKLLVLDKRDGHIEHRHFTDILDYLRPGDCLVLNDTRVIPARLLGVKEPTASPIEFVLLHKCEAPDSIAPDFVALQDEYRPDSCFWEVMLRPGKKAHVGTVFAFGDYEQSEESMMNPLLRAQIVSVVEGGNRIVKFYFNGVFEEILDRIGIMPLPPYIKAKLDDPERYQTVYSRERGSAAAPTAGLHFTDELLERVRNIGVSLAFVTLHVGLGTFRPVKVDNIEEHKMHSEYFEISDEACRLINSAHNKGRVIAVGTTSCRVIESAADSNGLVKAQNGWTDIFIYPGYNFKILDALITNFHLPESTLLMLVSSLAGRDNILNAYKEAVEREYRFFSFGDAMLID